jgi:hypothetical protein
VTRLALVLLAVASTLLLSSCGLFVKFLGIPTDCEVYTEVLDFDTSDLILRGTWTGVVPDFPTNGSQRELTLHLTASYVDRQEYAVAGTFELEGETPAAIIGSVSGGCRERYDSSGTGPQEQIESPGLAPQSIPPGVSFRLEVRGGGALLWIARDRPARFSGSPADTMYLDLMSEEANPHHSIRRDVDLSRALP